MPQRVSHGCVRIPEISPPPHSRISICFGRKIGESESHPTVDLSPFPSETRGPPMFPEGTKPVAGRWRATTGLQEKKRMHPGGACKRPSIPLARPHGVHPFQIGSRWWRFSATHRLPSVFPYGNRMHLSRAQIPEYSPRGTTRTEPCSDQGKQRLCFPKELRRRSLRRTAGHPCSRREQSRWPQDDFQIHSPG
ncbi:MAG: hypothetical protein RLZZ253_319 [Verrucomicrobiota bacterium]|jgi:hypothetical protein